MITFLRNRLSRLRNERGNVIMMVGIVAFLLIMAVGVAVDMARAQILQQRISAALDAAGLAAASDVSTPDPGLTNIQWANQEAARYFFANIPQGYLGSNLAAPVVTFPGGISDFNTLNLTEQASQSPVFMQIFGYNTLSIGAASQVTRSNNGEKLEIALVLDNTGSMNNPVDASNSGVSKLAALKDAINGSGGLLDILYGSNETVANQYIGIVPFTQAVNIGTANNGWLSPSPTSAAYYWGVGGSWGGCVEARDLTDNTPAAHPFAPYYFQANTPLYSDSGYYTTNPNSLSNGTNNGYVNFNPWTKKGYPDPTNSAYYAQEVNPGNRTQLITVPSLDEVGLSAYSVTGNPQGPNRFCPQPIAPMVAEKTLVSATVSGMVAGGDTNLDLGMSWGYRMLSPTWRGTWGGEMSGNNLPLDYNTPNAYKYVILMTDGMNHYGNGNYTGYGFLSQGNLGTTDPTAAVGKLDTNTQAVCDAMRSHNIIVFTIGFGTDDNNNPAVPTSVNGPLLQGCAFTPAYYFLAQNNAQLAQAFQAIANAIENIRVSK